MLKHQLLHPQINEILGRAGHGATVLIADGNYPASSTLGPRGELVSLNLSPGIVGCVQVLQALVSAIPLEAAATMQPESDGEPPIWNQFREVFRNAGLDLALDPIERWQFYDAASTSNHVLTIHTADQALYANLLLTIGVRT